MEEREGVIKYRLEHQQQALSAEFDLNELNAWRTVFYRLKLIGMIPEKYQGLGFGNISRRLVPAGGQFLISGTQTGHLAELGKQDYVLIQSASPQQNSIQSCGLRKPSSEALTHAGVYQQSPAIQAVIHVHSPELWRNTLAMHLPHTGADIPYGTPEMAAAVAELFSSGQLNDLQIFSMLGHEDGIIAYGNSLAEAAALLIAHFAKALTIEYAAKDG